MAPDTAPNGDQDRITTTAAFGGPDAGLPLDADGKWHGVIDDPGLVTEPATAALDAARELVVRKIRGISAFSQEMRDAGIHVGMAFGGSVLCVNCGGVWPCEGVASDSR